MISGGLICRGFLEAYPDHNVRTFISLSSPQAGQFGGWTIIHFIFTVHHHSYYLADTDYLKFFFPNFTRDNLYLLVFILTPNCTSCDIPLIFAVFATMIWARISPYVTTGMV